MKEKLKQFTDSIKNEDKVFIYTETWFTGFAPCFDNNLYSLACCMGNKKNGGMKARACKKFEEEQAANNVWVLSVAGKDIADGTKHNCSDIVYKRGDMICLAKVTNAYTWEEYYSRFAYRRDAIYKFDVEKKTMICVKHKDHTQKNAATDCALNNRDFRNLKQIVISEQYVVFEGGHKLPQDLSAYRGGKLNEDMTPLREYICNNDSCIKYVCERPKFDQGRCANNEGCSITQRI